LRTEFDTARVFDSLKAAQAELDEWVEHYNTDRPHQALDDATPASRFLTDTAVAEPVRTRPVLTGQRRVEQPGQQWVSRKVGANGIVCVGWQQVSVGKHHAGRRCDVLVLEQLLQFWVDDELLKTVARTSTGQIRKKRAQGSTPRS
jgi:Integrase core domain